MIVSVVPPINVGVDVFFIVELLPTIMLSNASSLACIVPLLLRLELRNTGVAKSRATSNVSIATTVTAQFLPSTSFLCYRIPTVALLRCSQLHNTVSVAVFVCKHK